jgi:hypothetical protein
VKDTWLLDLWFALKEPVNAQRDFRINVVLSAGARVLLDEFAEVLEKCRVHSVFFAQALD